MNKNLVSLDIIKKQLEKLPKAVKNNISDYGYSKAKNKKYYVVYNNKKINYGDIHYEDYLIHKDEKRREQYISRHHKDKFNDPTKPGYYSLWVLWD